MTRYRILTNAKFVTDGDRLARAVAVADEKIVAVGDLNSVRDQVGARAEQMDLGGGTVFPGFADSHVHVLNFGRSRMGVPCWPSDVDTVSEIVDRVRTAHQREPVDKWIRGRGYDPTRLAEGRAPTADELELDGGRCVVLDSFDFHRRVANRAALDAAGIGPDTPDPADGEIIRDAHGVPTGELVDGARGLMDRVMPPWSDEEDEQAIQIASDHFLSLGFTYVTNAAPLTMSRHGEEIAAFLRLSERDELRVRFTSMMRHELLVEASELGLRPGIGSRNFLLGGAKVFADGALGTRTAFLSEPYSGSENLGSMRMEPHELEEVIAKGAASSWQMCVHAQGDQAISLVADVMRRNPISGSALNHRIEHCCLTSNSTIEMMVESDIVPVPQLGFLRYRSSDFAAALGEKRVGSIYPLRAWIDAGLRPIHSSDSPVIADARPFAAIATAVTRADAEGNIWGPEQAITVEEGIAMMTTWAAAATGLEHERGQIRPGYLADFTVLDTDPRDLSTEELSESMPSKTIIGGEVVWTAR